VNPFGLLGRRPANLEQLARALLPNPKPGRFFTEAERRTLMAVAEVVLADSPVKLSPAEVADNVDTLLREGGSRRAWRVRLLYVVVELAPVFMLRERPFSRQSPASRRRLIEAHFQHGRGVWAICAKARHLVYLGCYADARANAAVGFVPVAERERYTRRQTAT